MEDDDKINDCASHDNYTEFQKTNPLARGDKNIKPLDIYVEHAEIRKQIYDEIKKLHFMDYRSGIIQKFLDCISPLKQLHDPGRLPIYLTKSRSSIPDRKYCVWAIVSCLIQTYWEYETNNKYEDKGLILIYLKGLREINEHYPEMKIAGAENKGYWLELD